jgi:ferrous iron transport protein B
MGAALILRRTVARGAKTGFMMEMPKYQIPRVGDIALGLWQRATIFLKRAGGIILVSTVVLWALLSFPQPSPASRRWTARSRASSPRALPPWSTDRLQPRNRAGAYPAMAAREVAVSALATVYSIEETDEAKQSQGLIERLRGRWPLPTAWPS